VCVSCQKMMQRVLIMVKHVSAGDKYYIDHFRRFVYSGSPMQCFMQQNSNYKCGASGTITAVTVVQCLCLAIYWENYKEVSRRWT
jgi:hypothetical protein